MKRMLKLEYLKIALFFLVVLFLVLDVIRVYLANLFTLKSSTFLHYLK